MRVAILLSNTFKMVTLNGRTVSKLDVQESGDNRIIAFSATNHSSDELARIEYNGITTDCLQLDLKDREPELMQIIARHVIQNVSVSIEDHVAAMLVLNLPF